MLHKPVASNDNDRRAERVVILEAKDFQQWARGDAKGATALMKPAADDVLQMWPVSKRVNSSRADGDDVTLIDKIAI